MSLDGQVTDENPPTVTTTNLTSEPAGGRLASSIVWARSFLVPAGPGSPDEGGDEAPGRVIQAVPPGSPRAAPGSRAALAGPEAPAAPDGGSAPSESAGTWFGRKIVVAIVAAGVVARFLPAGPLWFDEAQSVGIARLPVDQIFGALREDGSPPLYYLLLHFWMLLAGRSAFAVRALSGIFSVATLPLFAPLARRLLPERARWPAILLFASSPFAIRFADEGRMYSLVVLIVALGALAVLRALEEPTLWRLLPVTLASGALALTHYWGLFLLAAFGAGLAWRAWRGDRPAGRVLVAMLASAALFAPWAPSLLFQIGHTGTPWQHAGPFASIVAVAAWAGAIGTGPAQFVAVPFVGVLLGLVVIGAWLHLPARKLAWIALGSAALGGICSFLLRAAVVPRYTSIGLVPYLLAAAAGVASLRQPWAQRVLAASIALGLVAGVLDATAPRTLAGQAATLLERDGSPQDMVVYCPDQLGPDVGRLLPGWYMQEMYPTGAFPLRVDWVDYAARNWLSSPGMFARAATRQAGDRPVWLLESDNFTSYFGRCQQLVGDLGALRPDRVVHYLGRDPMNTTQKEYLIEYLPPP
ncbi:MAG: glycosyltransferase family 39 protein [Actinomycetota bacterium]|nr:glycosyltransferase family 39 protein [Actinomycetota bacterium]